MLSSTPRMRSSKLSGDHRFLTSALSSHSNVRARAGLGAAESPQGRQRGAGLRQGLPELHLRVHLQQLSGALQPAVPASRAASELLSI